MARRDQAQRRTRTKGQGIQPARGLVFTHRARRAHALPHPSRQPLAVFLAQRLGVDVLRHAPRDLDGLEGILVHDNCESTDFDDLLRIVERLVDRLDPLLRQVQWVNLGGGYLFGDIDDREPLDRALRLLDDFGVEVLFEPGTALVARAGSIVTTVVDVVERDGRVIAILDTSVAHAPEVFEYQFAPTLAGDEGTHTYLLAGASCLAGDTFGIHQVDRALTPGTRVVLVDVGAYSLVKASWFNGLALPTVYSRSPSGELVLRRQYTFDDFSSLYGGDHDAHRRA